MPKRVIVDENGLVVRVESAPERTAPPSSKKSTWGNPKAKQWYGPSPQFKWVPSTRPKVSEVFSRSALARQRVEENRRQARERAASIRAAEEALKRAEGKLPAAEQLTNFNEAYALGVAASKVSPPNYSLAIAAFKKAFRLDPGRR